MTTAPESTPQAAHLRRELDFGSVRECLEAVERESFEAHGEEKRRGKSTIIVDFPLF